MTERVFNVVAFVLDSQSQLVLESLKSDLTTQDIQVKKAISKPQDFGASNRERLIYLSLMVVTVWDWKLRCVSWRSIVHRR